MKKKLVGSCLNCKWREGSRCRKNPGEKITLQDWCASHTPKKEDRCK